MADYAYLMGPNEQWYPLDNITGRSEESLVRTMKIKIFINHSGKEEETEGKGWLRGRFGMLKSLERFRSAGRGSPQPLPFATEGGS